MRFQLNTVSSFQIYHLVRYSTLVITGVVFAKTTLSQQAIGEYETFVFVAGAFSFFWLNGMMKALLSLSSGEKDASVALFSSFVLLTGFSVLVILLLGFLHPLFSMALLNGKEVPELRLLLIYLFFGTPANLVEYYYLIRKKNRCLVNYALISFFIQFLFVVIPVIMGYPVRWAIWGLVISSLLRYIWLWALFIYFSEISFSMKFIREHIRLGMPLVLATLLSGSAQYIDGFIVTSGFDESTFAVFRYGARELPLSLLLTNALGSAMLPAFGNREKMKENLLQLKRSLTRLMHFLFPLTAILLLVSHPVFPVLFNPSFADSATIFNVYLLLVISRLLMPQTILIGLRQTKPIMIASLLELLINVALSLLFVRFWGIAGIAFATFVAYLFEKAYLVLVVRRRLGILFSDYQPVKYYVCYSVGIAVLFIFAEIFY